MLLSSFLNCWVWKVFTFIWYVIIKIISSPGNTYAEHNTLSVWRQVAIETEQECCCLWVSTLIIMPSLPSLPILQLQPKRALVREKKRRLLAILSCCGPIIHLFLSSFRPGASHLLQCTPHHLKGIDVGYFFWIEKSSSYRSFGCCSAFNILGFLVVNFFLVACLIVVGGLSRKVLSHFSAFSVALFCTSSWSSESSWEEKLFLIKR